MVHRDADCCLRMTPDKSNRDNSMRVVMSYKVTWKPSPNFYLGRSGHIPIAIVNHRMVGYLTGTDRHFSDADNEVSTHFGVGTRFEGGPVEISQYVDLGNTAWGNGNYDPSGGWPRVKRNPDNSVINPNFYTVSIEYQDGAEDEQGVVKDVIKNAGLWLQALLLTGDQAKIRAAGIRISSGASARGLKEIYIDEESIIDHHRIAGTKKPHCWRPWLADKGFLPWKTTLIPALWDSRMATLDELLAQLKVEADRLKAENTAALAARDTAVIAKNTAEGKLATAKQKAADITAL